MRLYGAIGPRVDGDYFAQELASLDRGDFDMIHIRMNSPGGNVFQGMSIVSAILSMNTPVCVHIDGIAASMAAVVAVAADRVCMMDFAKMMIHDPYFTGESGKATSPKQKKALARLTDMLRQVLVRRGKDEATMAKLMREETWFSATEALDAGLCDEITSSARNEFMSLDPMQLVAAVDAEYQTNNREQMEKINLSAEAIVALGSKSGQMDEAAVSAAIVAAVAANAEQAALDAATLRLMRMVATGGRTLSRAKLSVLAHEHPRDLLEASAAWQRRLTALVEPYGFFDTVSRRAQHIVLGAAIFLAVVAVAAIIWVSWRAGVLALATAAAMGVLGNYTMRRSPEGNDIAAHAKALRNWMRDGGWSFEGDKLAPDERAALIPYAYLFGALKSLGFGASADAGDADAGDAATAVREKAPMAAPAAPAAAPAAPVDEAAFLAALAPVFSQSLDEALRAAHKRAEVS